MRELVRSTAKRQRMTCYRAARKAIDDVVCSHVVTPELERQLRERLAVRFGRLARRGRACSVVPTDEVVHEDAMDRVCGGGNGDLRDGRGGPVPVAQSLDNDDLHG